MMGTKRFVKPTPEQVTAYALTIDYVIDGEAFCDFYESKGWVVGRSPMKSWEACVRTWKRMSKKKYNKPAPSVRVDGQTLKERYLEKQ